MSRALHAILLVFAFLFAQAGWAAHTATHVVVHQTDDQGLPSDAPCELCVGYAQLGAGAPLPVQPVLPVCEAHYQKPESIDRPFFARVILHSRTRAPPVHLV